MNALGTADPVAPAAPGSPPQALATLSHEVRTPLAGVVGALDLLLDAPLDAGQRELACMALESAHSAMDVVDDMLHARGTAAERLEPRDGDLDPVAVVEGAAGSLVPEARRKGLRLTTWVDPRLPASLRGDARWLRQVLTNLVANAVRFTDAGAVEVAAAHERGAARAVTVRFTVSDTGPGIAEGDRERLFEPFVRLDDRGGGAGLGLAIGRRLVRAMGGDLRVDAAPGGGSAFSFALTLRRSARAAPAPASERELRVLVVEPCDATARVVDDYLTAAGMLCERVASADVACRRVTEAAAACEPFDVAIVGTDPGRIADRLRAARGAERLALVLLADGGGGAAGPFQAQLGRPVRRARLLEAVTLAADRLAARQGVPAPPIHPRPPRGIRVLVADDDAVNRELVLRQLARLGVTADAVGSGADAVRAVAGGGYDAVLLDCRMPGVDGLEAARAIRAAERRGRRATLVAVTAGAAPDAVDAALAAGMDACLTKPLSVARLGEALARVIPPAAPEAAHVDGSVLGRLKAELHDDDAVRRIAGLFVAGLPGARAAIARALARGDADGLRRNAHRLRSSSAHFGALRLAELSGELEERAGSGAGRGETAELAAAVARESRRVADELAAEVAR